MTEFEVVGKVCGKQRPRFANGHAYTPEQTRAYEKHIAMSYIGQGGKHYGDAPVEVLVTTYIEPPKSWSRKKRAEIMGTESLKKIDVDNIAKVVLDGLQGYAFNNDMQVVHLSVGKYYGEREHLYVAVREA